MEMSIGCHCVQKKKNETILLNAERDCIAMVKEKLRDLVNQNGGQVKDLLF
jgi:hypothetical protein